MFAFDDCYFKNPLLQPIDNVFVSKKNSKASAEAKAILKPILIDGSPFILNAENITKIFRIRGFWDTTSVPTSELVSCMPSGVVSSHITKVSVWRPILSSFSKKIITQQNIGNMVIMKMSGEDSDYFTAVDFSEKLLGCSCPFYTQHSSEARFLCKHLFKLIYELRNEFLTKTNIATTEWLDSLEECRKNIYADVMMANWLYYFTTNVMSQLELKAGQIVNKNVPFKI
ncbi:MAG: hypothetical protein NWF09_07635 [Candidatus Bathyarchaeota archaeon]|nr:hypothetical protein [Candidatus Bathyarchaeota archaeon]